jgi:hypothetical protein
MTGNRQSGKHRSEAGSALLIAIFALLLISVVGLALLVSTGTDTALALNYRNSTSSYYAAVAGLEEARGRLLQKNADYINKTGAYPTLFMGQGTPSFGLTDVLYIVNPAAGEAVDPTDSTSPYADKEYQPEMGWSLSGANVHNPVNSVSAMAGFPGPSFKWVRINPVTAQALGLNVSGAPPPLDSFTPLYSNGNGLNLNNAGNQALEITAFVMMPDNSKRLLQYVVAPNSLSMNFPAALTLAGNGVSYVGPTSSAWNINGNDPTTGRTCATPVLPSVYAIGFTNPADQATVMSGTSADPNDYTGFTPPPPAAATPSIGAVTLMANLQILQRPSQVETLIQTISQGADKILSHTLPATTVPGAALPTGPTGMSPTNPMTIVVNGDLDLTSWHNVGYGLLLVTGKLIYDPDASWEGIVLVAGKGVVIGSGAGVGRFDGAFLVAQSRDPVSGVVLPDPNLGASSVTFPANMGGYGIYYNSCTIQLALWPTSYRVISFREITQ